MHRRQRLGAWGEGVAAAHLADAGMHVVARNWRPGTGDARGELDLVLRDGPTLVVAEVKTRSSAVAGGALAAVGWDKRRRLRRLTGLYLAAHPHRGPVRGDVVAVEGDADGWTVVHLRGAW